MLEAAVDRLLDVAERAGVDRVRLELPGLGPKRTIAHEIAGVRLVGGGREIVERWRSIRRRRGHACDRHRHRSEEHTSELQSLMRISYAVFCLKKKNTQAKVNNDVDISTE